LHVILSSFFCAAKDLGEPRDVALGLRHNNRAFGSLPSQTATTGQGAIDVAIRRDTPVWHTIAS
jgi:hypothetical protein